MVTKRFLLPPPPQEAKEQSAKGHPRKDATVNADTEQKRIGSPGNGITSQSLPNVDFGSCPQPNSHCNSPPLVFAMECKETTCLVWLSVEAAKSWIDAHVECYQGVNIKYIVAEFTKCPQRLQFLICGDDRGGLGAVLGASYPPSSGAFTDNAKGTLSGILQFLSDNHAPLLINVYPYFVYAADPTNIRLDHVQFAALGPVVRDGDLSYWNLLDAMVDAYYTAMEREDFPTVGMKISQSRWPSAGNRNFTTPQLALTYNQNFMKNIKAGTGTPKRPDRHLVTYS
ncbi:probable glucan endo-1,3-beta-glucosidase BG4 [Eucalyptus grandis]|uniref:probable glucan endo-1,3-beta-glucosidase BG4 n=1 Tax=Eucalyptus grandis TaxID=71139 RepID=UPI00192EDF1F|nr:probable glucan endo-1,3-beta-glucosidase BG4 [Eucalyptus grandis]